MKYFLLAFLALFYVNQLTAQEIPKRFAFAKSYFGIDLNLVTSYGESQFINELGQIENFNRNGYLTPSINIGATHFWGYADIYVSIPTANFNLGIDAIKTTVRSGTFTGFRVYPFRLTEKKISPYLGYKFSPFRYNQQNLTSERYTTTKVKSTLDLGLGYRLPNFYFYAGFNKLINTDIDIYVSRIAQVTTTLPNHFFNFGINWMIETTVNSNNDISRHFDKEFSESNRYGLFFGLGPSSVFQIGSLDYNKEFYPFLDDKEQSAIFPDISVGYHFTKLDLITAISYRNFSQEREAFAFSQKLNRRSFLFETYKFIGDYHGFVPFIGGGLGYETLSLNETDRGNQLTNLTKNIITPIITFGWDIRPSRKGDWWLLRTNLRYTPDLNLEYLGEKISFKQLEFNFIQFVIYPQRLKKYKKFSVKR